jgi:phage protein D
MRFSHLALKIDGKADLAPLLRRLTYTEAVGELDGMTAIIRMPQDWKDSKKLTSLLMPGKPFKIEIHDEKAKVLDREGDIIAVSHERNGKSWMVTLVGLNYLHRLRAKHITQVWEDAHDKIVKTIAGRAKPSLTAKVQGVSSTANFTFQQNETDAVFLMRLAREHNYFCRVVGKELHFGRRDVAYGAAVKLNYVEDVFDVRLTANLKDHLNEVHVFWGDHEKDGTKLKKVTYKTAPKALNSGGKLGSALGKSAFGVKSATIGGFDSPLYQNQSQAKAKAQADIDVAALDFIEGVARCRDVPKAACGAKLTLENAGWPFDGSFIITKVFHEFTFDGLRTEITFRSNSLPKVP